MSETFSSIEAEMSVHYSYFKLFNYNITSQVCKYLGIAFRISIYGGIHIRLFFWLHINKIFLEEFQASTDFRLSLRFTNVPRQCKHSHDNKDSREKSNYSFSLVTKFWTHRRWGEIFGYGSSVKPKTNQKVDLGTNPW
jgi:hypothetical protein